jgi:hypothetical protein
MKSTSSLGNLGPSTYTIHNQPVYSKLNRDVLLEHKVEKCPYRVIFIDPNSQENRRDCFFGVDRELVDKITYLWRRILHDRDSSLPVE